MHSEFAIDAETEIKHKAWCVWEILGKYPTFQDLFRVCASYHIAVKDVLRYRQSWFGDSKHERTHIDKAEIFEKIGAGHDVYLFDPQEPCVMKCFAEGERVVAMLKRHGEKPYKVDIRDTDIYDIMCESHETIKEVYEQY